MFRFFYIIGVLVKYGVIFILLKLSLYKKPTQLILKGFFEEAGGSFIKFGQLLALRIDVLPNEYSAEILDLLDNVRPFSYQIFSGIFTSELGAPPEDVFRDVEKEVFASGSFGQVHRARLQDGTVVTIKIMRPGIESDVAVDMIVISLLVFFVDLFFKIPALSWHEFAQEFKKWTLEELNYLTEAEHAQKMYNNLKDDPDIVIPKTYTKYSTRKILVQDYIDGIHLSKVLLGLKNGKLSREDLLKYDIDIEKIPSVLSQAILRQEFYHGYFHADVHPGNIILLKDNKIGLIDFGIIGEWRPLQHESFIKFMTNMGDVNFKEATYYFADIVCEDIKQMIGSTLPASVQQKDIDDFLRVLTNHFSETVEKTIMGSVSDLKEMKTDYSVVFMRLLSSAKSYRLKVPRELATFIKLLATLGFVSKQLNNRYEIKMEIQRFFKENPNLPYLPDLGTTDIQTRINREKAREQLANWLAYLIEKDVSIYKLVNDYIKKYNVQ